MKAHLSTLLRLLIFTVLGCTLSVFVRGMRTEGEAALLFVMGQGIFVILFSAFFLIVSLCLCRELPKPLRVGYILLMAAVFVFLPPACIALLVESHALSAGISAGGWILLSVFIK